MERKQPRPLKSGGSGFDKMDIPDDKELKNIYSKKKRSIKKYPPKNGDFWSFDEFKEWYEQQYSGEPVCYYCKIPEKIIEKIYWDIRKTKRPKTRTKLEIERLDPFGNYNKLNAVLDEAFLCFPFLFWKCFPLFNFDYFPVT